MIRHIFLDLDGVITDFHSEYGAYTKEEWRVAFPKFIIRKGFLKLKKLDDADELMDFIDSLGIPITILSSAGNFPDFYQEIVSQKIAWLHKHNINYPALVVPRKELKAAYAKPDSVLIDDQLINISMFEEAGGYGIQHKSADITIERLKILL